MKSFGKGSTTLADWLEDLDEELDMRVLKDEDLELLSDDEEGEINAYSRQFHREQRLKKERL